MMKEKLKNYFFVGIMLYFLLELILQRDIVFSSMSYSFQVWFKQLVPSMFPIFVVSDILISFQITNYIPRCIKNTFCSIFGVRADVITVFFLSFLSGFPTNARMVKSLYEHDKINSIEASKALVFTHFSNPFFVVSTVGVMFLHHKLYGYIILISIFFGNIVLGLIIRKYAYYHCNDYTEKKVKSQSFSVILVQSIKKAIDSLLLILGTITCFFIVSSFLTYRIHLDSYNSSIMKGILEITMGLRELSLLSIPDIYKIVISTMFLSFGGFSVHLQVLSQLIDTDISYFPFFVSRIIHAVISGGISFLLFVILRYFGYI